MHVQVYTQQVVVRLDDYHACSFTLSVVLSCYRSYIIKNLDVTFLFSRQRFLTEVLRQ